jgi:hypothetical protein
MAAPVCFPVSHGAIVGGLNSWSSEAPCGRQRANSRMVDTSRCAALAYQLYEDLSRATRASTKTAICEHAILLSKTMAAIVFDDGHRQGIINRGLRPPSEEREGLASRRDGDREFGTPKKAGPPSRNNS